jgi:hypothetical protein
MPAPLTPEDVRLAVRAVVVHTAEEWPTGPLCRNDGASYPCRLHRWGRRVLEAHGLNERQIEALIRHGNPFVHVPFPFTATGPSPARAAGARPATTGYSAPAARTAGARPATTGHPAPAGRTGGLPTRQQAARAVPPGVRPTAAGRPVTAPVTAPRWPRAS